ncbi:hypothetical protein [Candidatus Carsonella ruddii]|uniref:Uncharacterized protein n=1 Tax=Carsonella ruddii TaxID=114186 RepID=A0AAE7G499_CARRU|nr:hypothetical protein [Candidatus Carsonella ruddii]AGS06650.1 hypothetical protein CRDC_00830 [Candidatus Carsonella ruddii DC]ALA96886.1 hypothetical protein AMC76_00875 [Candidatus Carsonella ruddii]QLK14122.1 hypothetical protein FK493_00880 [Candidatus Carsonella ruddii]
MKYNIRKKFIICCFKNLIKFGKIKSNYYKLKNSIKKILNLLRQYFKKEIFLYLLKVKIIKGNGVLLGEIGIYNNFHFYLIK